jgi:hypothetical protein
MVRFLRMCSFTYCGFMENDSKLHREETPDDSSQTVSETGSLGSSNLDSNAQHADDPAKQANLKASACFDSDDACHRPPPFVASGTNNENDNGSPNRAPKVEPPQPVRSTHEGDRVLMGFLAPNKPHLAELVRNSPLEPFSRPTKPRDMSSELRPPSIRPPNPFCSDKQGIFARSDNLQRYDFGNLCILSFWYINFPLQTCPIPTHR